jgi:hypothetical protein
MHVEGHNPAWNLEIRAVPVSTAFGLALKFTQLLLSSATYSN